MTSVPGPSLSDKTVVLGCHGHGPPPDRPMNPTVRTDATDIDTKGLLGGLRPSKGYRKRSKEKSYLTEVKTPHIDS